MKSYESKASINHSGARAGKVAAVVLFLVLTLMITSPPVMAGVFIVATLAVQAVILKNKIDYR